MRWSAQRTPPSKRDPYLRGLMIHGSTPGLSLSRQFGTLPGVPTLPATDEATADANSDDMTASQKSVDWNWSELGLNRSHVIEPRSIPQRRAPWRPDW